MTDNFLETVNIAKKLPSNINGNDYVIGDIHGMVHQVDLLLKEVKFNESVDRLFLVGDLADRGPNSIDSLSLLLRPYVHAVMGNHEELLLCTVWGYLTKEIIPYYFECEPSDLYYNGGDWFFQGKMTYAGFEDLIKYNELFYDILIAASKLPLVLSVGEGSDRFNITHSEFNGNWTDEKIDQLPEELPILDASKGKLCLSTWDRSIFDKGSFEGLPLIREGLSTTFTGHTIGSLVRKAYSHVCMDTGAFLSLHCLNEGSDAYSQFGLSIINARTLEYLTVDAKNTLTRRNL